MTIGFEVDDDDVVVVVVVTGVEVELYVVVMGVVVTVGKTGIVTLVVGIEGIVIGVTGGNPLELEVYVVVVDEVVG